MVTPATRILQKLQPLTFGSFLPPKLKAIPEETDASSIDDEILLQDLNPITGKDTTKRKLHFSDAGTSTHPTPTDAGSMRGNRSTGKSLKFIPPAIKDGVTTVTIEEEDICAQVQEWESALIGFVIGDNPYGLQMNEYVTKLWGFFDKPHVLFHEDGYYIFRFKTIKDKDNVLQSGPYFYRNKPVILRQWEIDFDFEEDIIRQIPIRVKFPKLPVGYWSVEALSKVASAVGNPMHTDSFTANAEKISYARILIEVDILQPLQIA